MDDFIAWFTSHGATLDAECVGLVNFLGQSRGAVALQDISENHTLFNVPRTLTLSMRTSKLPSRVGVAAWRRMRLHKGWVGLILCMMWEEARGEESPWYGYLQILPTEFDTPMFWSSKELHELEGTTILGKIGKEEAERDYHERLVPAVQGRPDLFDPTHFSSFYSLENYHFMGSRILSRSFRVEKWESREGEEDDQLDKAIIDAANAPRITLEESKIPATGDYMEVDGHDDDNASEQGDNLSDAGQSDDEDGKDPFDVAMVPMADMLNARYGSENAKLFHEPTVLKMVTTRAIKEGEQIYNTYGNPPNSDLLRRYGHVDLVPILESKSVPAPANSGTEEEKEILGNPADVIEIPADLAVAVVTTVPESSKSSTPSGSKVNAEVLKERIDWWLEEGGDDVFVLDDDPGSTPGGSILPPALISFLRLLSIPEDWERAKERGKPPKPHLDVSILAHARELLVCCLSRYPTTLAEDESFLSTFPPLTTVLSSDIPRVTRRKLHALVVRLGEKRILHRVLERVELLASKKSSDVNKKENKGKTVSSDDGRAKRKKEEKRSGRGDGKEKRAKK